MRILVYGGVSTLSATCAVLAAFRQRANFYAAAVYLSKSNACMMILCNLGIFCTIVLAKILQSIFFGQLRLVEIERLHERLWFTISETLLALAMFRDEFDTSFVVLFISLVFVKCFHWLAADRVDWMDQVPTPPGKLFHARMVSILSIIWITDMLLIAYATESVLLHGPSVVLMFEMEYIIMQVTCLSIISKYILNSYSHYRAQEHWEGKSTYQFYIDLATDFLKLITYIGFLSLTLTFHALPINVLRDVYYTFKSFVTKCNNLVRFRQATRNMNERYPNATREEMEALVDKTCIICREEMEFREDQQAQRADSVQNNNNNNAGETVGPNDTPKKLRCGHIFHFHCLRSWLERQQTCPTCRRPVIQSQTPPQAAPQNPNAVANRAFAAAMAAAGVAPPPIPPAPAANGRAGTPAPQPAPPEQAGAGDGNLAAPRIELRHDWQQRWRDYQQRMNPAPFATNGVPPNAPLDSGSQNNSNRITGPNPLLSFDISALPGTTSGRSSAPQPNGSNNLKQASSSSNSRNLVGISTNASIKDALTAQSCDSSQRQAGTSQDQAPKLAQPEGSELEISGLKNGNPSTESQHTESGETKNPLQNFNPSSGTSRLKEQDIAGESSIKSYASKHVGSILAEGLTDGPADEKFDATVQKVKKEGLIRFPCLIPLFEHNADVLAPRSPSQSSSSLANSTLLNHQLIMNQYSQKILELKKLKIVSHSNSATNELELGKGGPVSLQSRNQIDQLIEIQNSLIDCCSKLATFVHVDSALLHSSILNDPHQEEAKEDLENTKAKGKNRSIDS